MIKLLIYFIYYSVLKMQVQALADREGLTYDVAKVNMK